MSDLNINSLSRSLGVDKPLKASANPRSEEVRHSSSDPDSVQLSKNLDISSIPFQESEQKVEQEFAILRERLRSSVESPDYPPSSTIDHLVSILAAELAAGTHASS